MSSTHARTAIPSVTMRYAQTGVSAQNDALGMRPMQARAYAKRGEPYLLIKSPPASGKSRALMFIALDKIHRQDLKQALILVPERAIGASFHSTPLSEHGFWADWVVEPRWNLCDSPGEESSMVESVRAFLASDAEILVCTHATFRFAFEQLGVETFDDRVLAVDEFHHVSSNENNKLGGHIRQLIERDRAHLVAMTGSYFRGDGEAVLHPEDEARFAKVTYTYYEQLNGYQYLKDLDIGYYFYSDRYVDALPAVITPGEKTIVHIPSVNSRESTKDKYEESNRIVQALGTWDHTDEETGFYFVRTEDGRMLRVADLVDDEPARRERVARALRDPAQKHNRDHVDIIIALGMAKEGFDWIWCEHALTIGYRSSLTEIVQIIGRTTRDAPGKHRARFTNLIAEPTADQGVVSEAVNDTLKAIAASLLMEQVLAPKFVFRPKNAAAGPEPDVDYGEGGYDPEACNVGVGQDGQIRMEIKGLAMPASTEGKRICEEDLHEVISSFVQDSEAVGRGVFDTDIMPQEITQVHFAKIVQSRYPDLATDDQEAVRQHAVALFNTTQGVRREMEAQLASAEAQLDPEGAGISNIEVKGNTSFIDGVRRFIHVQELDIELIDAINPFGGAYAILSKSMNEGTLRNLESFIAGRRTSIDPGEAYRLALRAHEFKTQHGRAPSPTSTDKWEQRMAEGIAAFMRYRREGHYG